MNKKTRSLIYVSFAALVVLGVVLYASSRNNAAHSDAQTPEETQLSEQQAAPDDDSSPTSNEEEISNQVKEDIPKQFDDSETDQDPSIDAQVEVVDAAQYGEEIEVRAFVANIIQDGDCTITFSQNDTSFTKEVPAYADASTTPCIALFVPRSEFPAPGTWEVEIVYTSTNIQGKANSVVEVQ